MKILTVAPTPYFADRGTHIRILEEARAQVRRGHDVTIATYHIGKTPQDEISQKIDVRRIHRWLFWYKKLEAGPDWQKILLDALLLRKTLFLALRQKPDVLHAHLHEGVLIAWCVQKIIFWRSIIVVSDMHGSLVNEMSSHGYLSYPFVQRIFRAIEKWINTRGDVMVASSTENQRTLQQFRDDAVDVQLDGVDIDRYEGMQRQKVVLRKKYNIPGEKDIIVYAGAMVANKGLRYLLEATPFVAEQNKNVHFVLAGFPVEYIEAFIKKNNIESLVTIISPLTYEQLPEVLTLGDIAVDPKDAAVQQASGKILQYMGAGLPVVCFDKENNRAYLDDVGMYATEVSAYGLTRAMIELLNDKELRAQKGIGARKRAHLFTWDNGAKVFEGVVARAKEQK